MSTNEINQGNLILSDRQRKRLFIASCVALATTAMVFSVRAAILDDLGAHFHRFLQFLFLGKSFSVPVLYYMLHARRHDGAGAPRSSMGSPEAA